MYPSNLNLISISILCITLFTIWSILQSIYLDVSIYAYIHISLSIFLNIQPIYISVCIYLSLNLFVYLTLFNLYICIYLSIYLSIYPSIHISIYTYLAIYLFHLSVLGLSHTYIYTQHIDLNIIYIRYASTM